MKKSTLVTLLLLVVVVSYSQNNTYRPGFYIDNDAKKFEGLISYAFDYRINFKFKSDENAKVQRISPAEATTFVIGKDSFTVIKDFSIEGVGGSLISIRGRDFVKVIKGGAMKLYLDYSSQGNPSGYSLGSGEPFSLHTYLIQKGNGPITTVRHRNRKKFKEQLLLLFDNDVEIKKNIEKDIYRWEDTPQIIEEYNSRH